MSSRILHPTSHFASRSKEVWDAPSSAGIKNSAIASWPLSGPSGNLHHMKKIIAVLSIAVITSLACPALLSAEEENEQTVQLSDLPAAVQTTIKDKAGTDAIEKIEKKMEDGEIVYEAVVNRNGEEWGIEVNEQGKFLKEYEESKENEDEGENY
jgi:hypothetical protein